MRFFFCYLILTSNVIENRRVADSSPGSSHKGKNKHKETAAWDSYFGFPPIWGKHSGVRLFSKDFHFRYSLL
jgi:hypothetical protein